MFLQSFSHWIFIWEKEKQYYPILQIKKLKLRALSNLSTVTEPEHSKGRIWTKVFLAPKIVFSTLPHPNPSTSHLWNMYVAPLLFKVMMLNGTWSVSLCWYLFCSGTKWRWVRWRGLWWLLRSPGEWVGTGDDCPAAPSRDLWWQERKAGVWRKKAQGSGPCDESSWGVLAMWPTALRPAAPWFPHS